MFESQARRSCRQNPRPSANPKRITDRPAQMQSGLETSARQESLRLPRAGRDRGASLMKVEVLYFRGCPNHLPTVERVRETLHVMGLEEEIREIEVDTQDQAEATAFLGSPSVRINDVDVEPSA